MAQQDGGHWRDIYEQEKSRVRRVILYAWIASWILPTIVLIFAALVFGDKKANGDIIFYSTFYSWIALGIFQSIIFYIKSQLPLGLKKHLYWLLLTTGSFCLAVAACLFVLCKVQPWFAFTFLAGDHT